MVSLVGMFGKLIEAQTQTNARVAELAVEQAETDERLNVFINVVERYISERRNGHKRGGETDASTPSG